MNIANFFTDNLATITPQPLSHVKPIFFVVYLIHESIIFKYGFFTDRQIAQISHKKIYGTDAGSAPSVPQIFLLFLLLFYATAEKSRRDFGRLDLHFVRKAAVFLLHQHDRAIEITG